jgi:transcriptional regulator with XRE-family HTH domain
MYLNVPMGYFWGSEQLENSQNASYEDFITLRQRVIGVLLKQRRLRARQSIEELARAVELGKDTIAAYESGDVPIPYLHLEQLSRALEVTVTHFVDEEHGPLARHEAEQRMIKQFGNLSPELQVFITKPGNENYLETAKKIGEMDVQRLRDLAASILDITSSPHVLLTNQLATDYYRMAALELLFFIDNLSSEFPKPDRF